MYVDMVCTLQRGTMLIELMVSGRYVEYVPATHSDPPEGGYFEPDGWDVVAVNGNTDEAVCVAAAQLLYNEDITNAEWMDIEAQVQEFVEDCDNDGGWSEDYD
jgi:hypothetical protein